MLVTLDVFSGRPNPTWRISGRQVAELRERLEGRPRTPAPPVPGEAEPLGFRGFALTEDVPGELVPSPVARRYCVTSAPTLSRRAAAPGGTGPAVEAVEEVPAGELDAAEWLLATAPAAMPDEVAGAVRTCVADLRRGARPPAPASAPAPPSTTGTLAEESRDASPRPPGPAPDDHDAALAAALGHAGCAPYLAPKQLGFWNRPAVQPWNNCYNYAANFVSGTRAQPGRRSGRIYDSFSGPDVVAAAVRDGMELTCRRDVRVVALAVWPGFDFHWWRLHPDGAWAHKIGWWPAQDRDNLFRPISGGLTPSTCDRGLYSEFVGYYFLPLSTWVV